MDYFENTTRLTEAGYTAILRMKRRRQRIVCRAASAVLAVPFLERCIFFGTMWIITGHFIQPGFLDAVFALLLVGAVFLWRYPNKQIVAYVQRTRGNVDLQAVNQYTFFPDSLRMMTTSSLEKYQLFYDDLTWARSDGHWIVLYFSHQDFTMLVDRNGFTRGTASACLAFLRNKIDGR